LSAYDVMRVHLYNLSRISPQLVGANVTPLVYVTTYQ